MYERFSDRARKVMQLANQAAQKLNHEYIGVEHILLGLLRMENSLALSILESLKPGPDMVTIGKLPQTPRAKKAIEFAMDFARTWEHTHVGTEHLLLGLSRDQDGISGQVLTKFGVTVEKVSDALTVVLKSEPKKETHAFMLAVPIWNQESHKSAAESARCVVTALANIRANCKAMDDDEVKTYESALSLLKKQINKAAENCN